MATIKYMGGIIENVVGSFKDIEDSSETAATTFQTLWGDIKLTAKLWIYTTKVTPNPFCCNET